MSVTEEGNLRALAERLGLKEEELLEQALSHPDNKLIAWLGDAVLYLAVTEYLYGTSQAPTSELDPRRQGIIKNPNLKEAVMNHLHLAVRVPRSERDPNAAGILATACEAMIGVIFKEKGYEEAASFVRNNLLAKT